jgi:hypothetical protein
MNKKAVYAFVMMTSLFSVIGGFILGAMMFSSMDYEILNKLGYDANKIIGFEADKELLKQVMLSKIYVLLIAIFGALFTSLIGSLLFFRRIRIEEEKKKMGGDV